MPRYTFVDLGRETKGALPENGERARVAFDTVAGHHHDGINSRLIPISSGASVAFEDVTVDDDADAASAVGPVGWPLSSATKVVSYLYVNDANRRTSVLYYYGRAATSASGVWWRMDRDCVLNESFLDGCYLG